MAQQKAPYVYQHYPKQVKNDAKEDIAVKDAREHWRLARKDFEQDEIAQEQFTPSLMDEKAEENNLLQLKKKPGRPAMKPDLSTQETSEPKSDISALNEKAKTGA